VADRSARGRADAADWPRARRFANQGDGSALQLDRKGVIAKMGDAPLRRTEVRERRALAGRVAGP
jgi:hypothetical protein